MAKNVYATFWWDCVKEAFRGSFDLANAWSGLWGPILVFLFFYLRGETLVLPDHLDGYALLLVLSFLCATWIGFFAVRLMGAPARRYANLRDTIPVQPVSDIGLALCEQMIFIGGVSNSLGQVERSLKAWFVRVTNNGGKFLQRCQLMFGGHQASASFELRPNESKEMPVLWFPYREDDPRPSVFFLDPGTGKIMDWSAWLPNPADYEITALSADTYSASFTVRLSATSHVPPREWSLIAIDRSRVF